MRSHALRTIGMSIDSLRECLKAGWRQAKKGFEHVCFSLQDFHLADRIHAANRSQRNCLS